MSAPHSLVIAGSGHFEVFSFPILVAVYQVGCVSADGVRQLLVFVGFEGYPCWPPLPGGRRTFRIWHIVFSGFAERLFQHRFATSYLKDDGKKFLAIIGDAAIGDVVAVPTDGE